MINEEYEAAKKIASQHLIAIERQLPRSLATREENIFVTLRSSKTSPIEQLVLLYNLMDDLYSFFSQYTPCHKGCCYCCHIEVSISSLEGEYIERKTGIERALSYEVGKTFGTPCPFLDKDACSIYDYRPFVCRRHNALFENTKWCTLDLCNNYTFPQVRFSEIEKSYHHVLAISGSSLADIRRMFIKRSEPKDCSL